MSIKALVERVEDLRSAQREYMDARSDPKADPAHREELGARVGKCAQDLDAAVAAIDKNALATIDRLLKERRFQDEQTESPVNPAMVPLGMSGILLAIDANVGWAKEAWYTDSAPYRDTGAFLRKIGALVIQAGEKFGLPPR